MTISTDTQTYAGWASDLRKTLPSYAEFIGEARRRLDAAKTKYGDFGAVGEEPAAGEPGGDAAVLDSPAVLEAIAAAVQQATAQAQATAALSEQGLKASRDAILTEKKTLEASFADLGSAEEIKERLVKLGELETQAAADKAGATPEALTQEAERIAAAKQQSYEKQRVKIDEATQIEMTELRKAKVDLQAAAHRAFVAQEIYLAALPPDHQLFQRGAENLLIDSLAPYVEQFKVDGLDHPVGRVRVNEARLPGKGADHLMDVYTPIGIGQQAVNEAPGIFA